MKKQPNNGGTGFRMIPRALKHRNYRLFFGGQSISLIGTWMQRVAISWLIYRLTNSVVLLGVVGFAGQIPTFIVSPFAGVIADRYDRHKIMLITQILAMFQAVILAVIVYAGAPAVWQIITLAAFLGVVNAFDSPARQSFVVEMIEDRQDLGNAIALNSSMVNMARLVGPSISGIVIAAAGEGPCFILNAMSFLAVIASLMAMKIPVHNHPPATQPVLHDLHEGLKYSMHSRRIRSVLLFLAVISIFGMPYQTLLPVFARDILHGGPHTFGFLTGCAGVGALVGTIYLASIESTFSVERLIPIAAGLLGGGLILFSLSRIETLSYACMFIAGMGMMMQMAASNTVIQTVVDDDKRARVMGLFTMAFMGMMPFGSLLAGFLAKLMGAPNTLALGGIICIGGAILFSFIKF